MRDRKMLLVLLLSSLFQPFTSSHPYQAPQKDAAAGQSAPQKEETGKISGTVVRSDTGTPLAKAVVTIWASAQPREGYSVRTDSGGKFEFANLAPGAYRLRAQRNGFEPKLFGQKGGGPGTQVLLAPGQKLDKTNFRLDPAGVISGSVYEDDGEPVEGLQVHAIRLRFASGGKVTWNVARTSTTDDLGNYRLTNLPAGFYYVRAGGPGEGISINTQTSAFSFLPTYFPSVQAREEASRVQVISGNESRGINIFVRVGTTYTVSGVLLDSASSSGPRRYSVGFARSGGTATAETSRQDGTFALRGLLPGTYTLVGTVSEEDKPTRRGYATVSIVNSDARVAIAIGRLAGLRGKARLENNPAFSFSGMRLLLSPETEEGVIIGSQIDEKGEVNIRNIPVGRYTMQAAGKDSEVYLKSIRCAGEDFTSKPFPIEDERPIEDCTFTFSDQVTEVSGLVRDAEDKPADGVMVVLVPQNPELRKNPRHNTAVQTDENGSFRLQGVIPGDYFAFAVAASEDASYFDVEFPERNLERAERLTLKAREQRSLTLKVKNSK